MATAKQYRVLIVDDSPTCRAIISRALEPLGASCDAAESASAALRLLAEEAYDLVTLDLDMPDVSGQDMLVTLRDTHPLLPVLVISGALEVKLEALYDVGASAVLSKPFNGTMVYAVAYGLLRRQTD